MAGGFTVTVFVTVTYSVLEQAEHITRHSITAPGRNIRIFILQPLKFCRGGIGPSAGFCDLFVPLEYHGLGYVYPSLQRLDGGLVCYLCDAQPFVFPLDIDDLSAKPHVVRRRSDDNGRQKKD